MSQEKIAEINDRIQKAMAAGKAGQERVLLVAVSKRQPVEVLQNFYSAGQVDFGENYLQEAAEKQKVLQDFKICWHYIGKIQKKKIKSIVGKFHWIHTVDRWDVAEKISETAITLGIKQKVLLQVNIGKEESKQGLLPEEFLDFLVKAQALEGLVVSGLMVFPPPEENSDQARHWLQEAHKLFLKGQEHGGSSFTELSMGTSGDFELAIEEGATMVRLGEVLLGPRKA